MPRKTHRVTDDRAIQTRIAADLDIIELRRLVAYCNAQAENLWLPYRDHALPLQVILDLYHAAVDAGFYDIEEWYDGDRKACLAAYRETLARKDKRQ